MSRDLAKYDATEDGEDRNAEICANIVPPAGSTDRGTVCVRYRRSRMEGAAKGLVYAATGIGKTYLAAFDSAKYERVLFVAHRGRKSLSRRRFLSKMCGTRRIMDSL